MKNHCFSLVETVEDHYLRLQVPILEMKNENERINYYREDRYIRDFYTSTIK